MSLVSSIPNSTLLVLLRNFLSLLVHADGKGRLDRGIPLRLIRLASESSDNAKKKPDDLLIMMKHQKQHCAIVRLSTTQHVVPCIQF